MYPIHITIDAREEKRNEGRNTIPRYPRITQIKLTIPIVGKDRLSLDEKNG